MKGTAVAKAYENVSRRFIDRFPPFDLAISTGFAGAEAQSPVEVGDDVDPALRLSTSYRTSWNNQISNSMRLDVMAMKIVVNGHTSLLHSSEQLAHLLKEAISTQQLVLVGEDKKRCLQIAFYGEAGIVLELNRGRRWSGWVSPMLEKETVCQLFVKYYQNGDLPDEVLHQEPNWLEMELFHPLVYILFFVVLAVVMVWNAFFP